MSAAARVLAPSRPSLIERARWRSAGDAAPVPRLVGGSGARAWDADNCAYFDFCNRDGAVILGHGDPAVAAAMADPDSSAAEEARARLSEITPCAEMVAFARSAPAALLAALRMARAATGRERVLVLAERPVTGAAGAAAVSDTQDLESRVDDAADVAAVVIEPLGLAAHEIAAAAAAARRRGAVVIFDERRSALRVHMGGIQALFGVRPDLAIAGGALGNGAQVAAVMGVRDLVDARLGPVPPEPAALAAVAATLRRVELEPVVATLNIRGAEVQAEVEALLETLGAGDQIRIVGDPTWSSLVFASQADRADFLGAAPAAGLYTLGDHVMSYAHGDEAVSALLAAYGRILPAILSSGARS